MPTPYTIDLSIEHPIDASIDAALLVALAEQTLSTESAPAGSVGIVITDDATVQTLNRAYRGLDEPTDVLSFGLGGLAKPLEDDELPAFVTPQGTTLEIGEVILAYPYAARHAAATNRLVRDEVALLIVHGVLHLLGHDHLEPDETERMQAREVEVLGAFGIAR